MSRAHGALGAILVLLVAVAGLACDKKKGLRVTGWEPKRGPYTGGSVISIRGQGFQEGGQKGIKVLFGDKEAPRAYFSGDEELKVEVPAGEIGQTVDLTLIFDDARSLSIEKAYTYDEVAKGLSVDALVEGKEAVDKAPAPAPEGAGP